VREGLTVCRVVSYSFIQRNYSGRGGCAVVFLPGESQNVVPLMGLAGLGRQAKVAQLCAEARVNENVFRLNISVEDGWFVRMQAA